MSDNNVTCHECGQLICSLIELIFVLRKDDVILTLHPNHLESFKNAGSISFSGSNSGSKEKQTIFCVGCNNKLGSSILVYNTHGPHIICFGVQRLKMLGLYKTKHSKTKHSTWYSKP